MTTMAKGMNAALRGLEDAVRAQRGTGVSLGNWRWTVRQRMTVVRDCLVGESPDADDGWLAARGGTAFRERNALLARLNDLGPRILEDSDVEKLTVEMRRLLVDISHHVQRLNDLAYDEVELELGGSE